jgi:hypothetical protein
VQPALGGERRPRGDRAAQALQAGEQRRLLADDVGARALDDRDVEREVAAEHARAEHAVAVRLRDRRLQQRLGARVLRARQDEAVVGPDGVARERHPLDQQVRVGLHEDLVDVGAGIALVAVGDDELALALGLARELPLRARREAGAAAAADGCGLDLLEQLLRRQVLDRALEALPVAAVREQLGPAGQPAAARGGLGRGLHRAREHARDDARPGVDDVAVADGGRGVAEAEADRLGERDLAVGAALAQPQAEPRGDLRDVLVGRRGEAGGAGADAHVAAAPARLEQVVVEGGDAVNGGLGQPRARGGEPAVVVGDLAALLDRLLEHRERGRGPDLVVAADDLDEVARHLARRCSHGGELSNRCGRSAGSPLQRRSAGPHAHEHHRDQEQEGVDRDHGRANRLVLLDPRERLEQARGLLPDPLHRIALTRERPRRFTS